MDTFQKIASLLSDQPCWHQPHTEQCTCLSPNGPIAAALLSSGFGWLLLDIIAVAAHGSKHVASLLIFYKPTGPLSGVTTLSIVEWLLSWATLAARWKNRALHFGRISMIAFAFLALSLLLTFPPFGDLILGR